MLFFLSVSPCSLPAAVSPLRSPPPPLPPGARPSAPLSPPFLSAFPPLVLPMPAPAVCSVAAVCLLLCPRPRGLFRPAFCVRAPEALRRPSVSSGCLPVTRLLSGAKRCDSVGRCTAYMSPALSPPVYVLPCVPLLVSLLVPWLPSVRPPVCVCPAVVCRLVVVIGGTPQYSGRLRFGAASAM